MSVLQGITPLMLASQEGILEIVRELLRKGALPNATTNRGSTALIQACHFGKHSVAELLLLHGALVDQPNLKNTTALMRASQEGHEVRGDVGVLLCCVSLVLHLHLAWISLLFSIPSFIPCFLLFAVQSVVRLLLSHSASVNRRNDERMTALMLSSQRGHANIVKVLVRAGAQVDAKTAQDSTSLMLACKRKHLDVAKILVAAGCELKLKDSKQRTVLETAARRGSEEFVKILTDTAQVQLMQEDSRVERNFTMVRVWKLLQLERATIRLAAHGGGPSGAEHCNVDMTIHALGDRLKAETSRTSTVVLSSMCRSKQALVRAMTLPAPLIELVSSFIPLPLIWEKRLRLLTSRSQIDPDSAVYNSLDLIDEVLEEGGILDAFDAAHVPPPSSFESWVSALLTLVSHAL